MAEQASYQSGWIAILEGLAFFPEESQFLKALKDGAIRSTGRFLDEIYSHQKSGRTEIQKAAWEDFTFKRTEGILEKVYEDHSINVLQWYFDIEVNYEDIIKIIAVPKGESGRKGGRPRTIDAERLYSEIAALIYFGSEHPIPEQGKNYKEWREELYGRLPYLLDLNEQHSTPDDHTVRRYLSQFLNYYHSALKKLEKESEVSEKIRQGIPES